MQNIAEFVSANPWLVLGLIASGLAVTFNELRLKARSIGSLSTPLAIRMINDGSKIVDVREAAKFAEGHIVDARNIPADELLQAPESIKQGKHSTLLICDTGSKSAEVAAKLRKDGVENVFSITGGLAAWQQENLPVVREG